MMSMIAVKGSAYASSSATSNSWNAILISKPTPFGRPINSTTSTIFPHEREARAGRGGDERRELRRDDVAQPLVPRKTEDGSHFIESGVERAHALT